MGAALSLVGLGLAVLSAHGVVDVAHARVARGVMTLVLVLAVRLLTAQLSEEWSWRAAGRVRDFYRARVVDFMRAPAAVAARARSDVSTAIEDIAALPELEVLSTSARVGILGLGVVLWSAGPLSATIVIALLGLSVPLYRRAGKRSAAIDVEYRARRATLESRQLELIGHAPDLRALGAVDFGASEIGAISDSEHAIVERAVRVSLGSSLITEFLGGVSIGLVAMVVGFSLLGGHLSLERGLIAVLVTAEVFTHVRRFGTAFHRRDNARQAREVLSTSAPTRSNPAALLRCEGLRTTPGGPAFSIDLHDGDRLVITGPSGAGKTTLLHTLVGWRAPAAGSLERRDVPLGFVSPESVVVSGSIWDNLTCAREADERDVRAMLERLGLSGARFADLRADLGADGRALSSGERVRVLLARALLARAEVLVLDDVAGVLDAHNRERLRRVLGELDTTILEATVDSPLLEPTQTVRM